MKKLMRVVVLLAGLLFSAFGQFGDPFEATIELKGDEIMIQVEVPANHYLYADHLSVTDAIGNQQNPIVLPETASITDPNSGKPKQVFDTSFVATYEWKPINGGTHAVHLKYWGCNDSVCFIPQTKVLELGVDDAESPLVDAETDVQLSADWEKELKNYEVLSMHSGGLNAAQFLNFIHQENEVADGSEVGGFRLFLSDPVAFVREFGLLLAIVFILIGGLALNLTPCVLPRS